MTLDFIQSSYIWILGIGALLVLIAGAFSKNRAPSVFFTLLTFVLALGALAGASHDAESEKTFFSGLLFLDPFAIFSAALLLVGGTFTYLLLLMQREKSHAFSEVSAQLLFAVVGAIIFVQASEFITFFLGLEIMSMAVYTLCGSAIHKRSSSESALKYFLLGSFSSAFLLYGVALLYGLTGTTHFVEISRVLGTIHTPIVYVSAGLILVGILFKLGIVPFHFWLPDVYEGAPTIFTAFMACFVKAAALFASIRVVFGVLLPLQSNWAPALWALCVLTFFVANVIGLRQRSLKRLFAYSSISHAGFMLSGFLLDPAIISSLLYYIVLYCLVSFGAFGVLLLVEEKEGSDQLSSLNGLSKRSPFLAFSFALFLLALAGLPPGLGGMFSKLFIVSGIVKGGYAGLAIIAMLSSVVACFYYLRAIVAMYFVESDSGAVYERSLSHLPNLLVAASVVASLFFGIFPDSLLPHLNLFQ